MVIEMQLEQIYNTIFGGNPEQTVIYLLCIFVGLVGASVRVFMDNRVDLQRYIKLNEASFLFWFKTGLAGVMGAIMGFLSFPNILGAFSTGFVSAYMFRYVLTRVHSSKELWVQKLMSGFSEVVADAIEQEIKDVGGIRSVKINDTKRNGIVYVVVDSEEKGLSAEKLSEIERRVNKYDQFGIDYQVEQPKVVPVEVKCKLFVTNETRRPLIQEKIREAIEDYFKNLSAGDPVLKKNIIMISYKATEGDAFQDMEIVDSIPKFRDDGTIEIGDLEVASLSSVTFSGSQ